MSGAFSLCLLFLCANKEKVRRRAGRNLESRAEESAEDWYAVNACQNPLQITNPSKIRLFHQPHALCIHRIRRIGQLIADLFDLQVALDP